ncbi:MAG: DUF2203 domain-containing protein [Gemmatimonadetes bacterium]|nr:DUF2203 domain-containing protein [Gemmatimonadota bacterium]
MSAPAFTVEQANRMLPYVRRIVHDIVEGYAAWTRLVGEFEVASARSVAGHPDPEAEALQREVQRVAADIEGCQAELARLGVEFKGFDLGLVDFPAEMDGRPVFLCWKLGEEAVTHWHDRDAGFAGRRPLAGAGSAPLEN